MPWLLPNSSFIFAPSSLAFTLWKTHTTPNFSNYFILFCFVLFWPHNFAFSVLTPQALATIPFIGFSSVQFSHSVVSDSLWPHESQHTRPPCPSPNPGVHSDSRPSSQWCHPAISSSVVPYSSCSQSSEAQKLLSEKTSLNTLFNVEPL